MSPVTKCPANLDCNELLQDDISQGCGNPCKHCCLPGEYAPRPSFLTPCNPGDGRDPITGCCESAEQAKRCWCGGTLQYFDGAGLNQCGCYVPGYTSHLCEQKKPPRRKPPPRWAPPPINPPPLFGGGLLIELECAPCEDGSIPTIQSDCDCSVPPGCGCGSIYCACQYEKCLSAAEQNPVLPGFPGLGAISRCLGDLGACERNPPPCPDVHSRVITQITCLKCPDGTVGTAPECKCKADCVEPNHAAPCAIGECLNLTTGCCEPCDKCHPPPCDPGDVFSLETGCCPPTNVVVTGAPAALRASNISVPAFMLPGGNAGSDFLAATAAIGV